MNYEDIINVIKMNDLNVSQVSRLAGYAPKHLWQSSCRGSVVIDAYYPLFVNAIGFAIKQKKEQEEFIAQQINLKHKIAEQQRSDQEDFYVKKILQDVAFWENYNRLEYSYPDTLVTNSEGNY